MTNNVTAGAGNDPDRLRADIEQTRRELGSDVDALADKVTPSKIVHRQTEKVKNVIGSVRDSVMGTASDVGEAVSSTVGDASDLPRKAAAKAQGNPLAVGLIAFGVGWLASSLLPASRVEKEITAKLKETAEPLIQEVSEVAKEVAADLKVPATEAADAVKDAAADAVDTVKTEASAATDDVRREAEQAKHTVQDQP